MKSRTTFDWRVFAPDGSPRARFVDATDAAAFVALLGSGSKVCWVNRVVWTEGKSGWASESYDAAAQAMHQRVAELQQKALARTYG